MVIEFIRQVSIYAIPLLIAVIAHEVAHGWVAEKLGDPTARLMGRISFNPLVHIDPLGTIILPAFLLLVHSPFLFGWARPVPVNFSNLRGGRSSTAWVALAGPLTNLMLAAVSGLLYHVVIFGYQTGWWARGAAAMVAEPVFLMARFSIVFNLVLMVINLFPIPPLDGGRILVGVLPRNLAWQVSRLERFGMLIIVAFIATGLWDRVMTPILSFLLTIFLH